MNIMVFIKKLGQPVFTTGEIAAISKRSSSTIVQCLTRLARQGLIIKICRSVWAELAGGVVSPFTVIPYLFPRQRVYVSFTSALHLHGIIEQIPQVITLASLSHTRTVNTKAGVFSAHQIAPEFFKGFDWYKGEGSFLVAEPEKALVDSLYLSSRRKKQFGYFPELSFPKDFSFKKAALWAGSIPQLKIRIFVQKRLKELKSSSK